MSVNFAKAVAQMKVEKEAFTDKDLFEPAKVSPTAFRCIKRGNPTWAQLEKLCKAWDILPSTFIKWGE